VSRQTCRKLEIIPMKLISRGRSNHYIPSLKPQDIRHADLRRRCPYEPSYLKQTEKQPSQKSSIPASYMEITPYQVVTIPPPETKQRTKRPVPHLEPIKNESHSNIRALLCSMTQIALAYPRDITIPRAPASLVRVKSSRKPTSLLVLILLASPTYYDHACHAYTTIGRDVSSREREVAGTGKEGVEEPETGR